MKKRVIGILLMTAISLAGCGKSEKVISGDVANVVTDNTKESEEEESAPLSGEEQSNEESAAQGYVFTAQGVSILIDGDTETFMDELGEPVSCYEAPSCAFGDLDRIYTYSGFEMDTYSLEGKEYVSAIVLQDDSVMTREGVCIGEPAEKIEEVYGEPSAKDEGMLVYARDNMKLCFIVKDNKIASIEYLSTILDN